MKIVKISMELVIPDDISNKTSAVVDYLNRMLYQDPEFFGDFGPENIETISLGDGTPVYEKNHGYFGWVSEE